MNTQNQWQLWLCAATSLAIATSQSPPATALPIGTRLVAQTTLCRAVNVDTPIFQTASTTTTALRIVPKDANLTLVALPPSGSQFAQISAPLAGYVQTAVLKQCLPTQPDPSMPTVCRKVVAPAIGNSILPEPTTASEPVLASVVPGAKVYLTLGSGNAVKTQDANGFRWVQVDLKQTFGQETNGLRYGWMVNTDLITSPNASNVVLCP